MRALVAISFLLLSASIPARADDAAPTVGETIASTGFGNADIYAGGEPRLARIELARKRLAATLAYLAARPDVDACAVPRCAPGQSASVCATLGALTPPQRRTCAAFVRDNLSRLRGITESAGARTFAISSTPLVVTEKGMPRSVAAMTRADRAIFHAGAVDTLAEDALVALVFHELAHRLVGAAAVRDDTPAGAFARGAELLDAAGATIALVALEASAPSQEPPALPETAWRKFCAAPDPHRAGMLADLAPEGEIVAAPGATAEELARTPAARRHWLRKQFGKYLMRAPLAEEEAFFLERLEGGAGPEALLASLVASPEYVPREAADAQFVRRFYADFAQREPAPEEIRVALSRLSRADRATWAHEALATSREIAKAMARGWYGELLNRSPSQAEVEDVAARLGAGETWASLQQRLLASPEYTGLQRKRATRCVPAPASGKK